MLTAYAHHGYGGLIGGAVAYKNKVSLWALILILLAGSKAVRTNVQADDKKTL